MIILLCALTLRLTVFFDTLSGKGWNLSIVYLLATWLPIMALNIIEGRKLMEYLKMHHRQKWEELTYVPFFGPGGHNGFRTIPWLYSSDDLGDPAVAALKAQRRGFIRFVLTVFFSYLIFLPLLST